MIEERVNSRRPTSEVSATPVEEAELPTVSRRSGDGERAGARSASSPGASEVIAVRMHSDGITALTEVQRHLGGSRSDAVRQAVEIVAGALFGATSIGSAEKSLTKLLTARRPVVVQVDETVLTELRDSMREVADRYSRQAFQLQKIGNNWNQVAKVANADGGVDADAVRGVERALDELARAMSRDAKRDATLVAKMRDVL